MIINFITFYYILNISFYLIYIMLNIINLIIDYKNDYGIINKIMYNIL